jgi:hypothetical protein
MRVRIADLIVQTIFLCLKVAASVSGQCRTRGIPLPRNLTDCRYSCPSLTRLLARYTPLATAEPDLERGEGRRPRGNHDHDSESPAFERPNMSEHMRKVWACLSSVCSVIR